MYMLFCADARVHHETNLSEPPNSIPPRGSTAAAPCDPSTAACVAGGTEQVAAARRTLLHRGLRQAQQPIDSDSPQASGLGSFRIVSGNDPSLCLTFSRASLPGCGLPLPGCMAGAGAQACGQMVDLAPCAVDPADSTFAVANGTLFHPASGFFLNFLQVCPSRPRPGGSPRSRLAFASV